jgi:hypothetical protein
MPHETPNGLDSIVALELVVGGVDGTANWRAHTVPPAISRTNFKEDDISIKIEVIGILEI